MRDARPRAPDAPDDDEEQSPMMTGDDGDMGGKFRVSRGLKYNRKQGRCAVITWHIFEAVWNAWLAYLIISGALELTYVNPAVYLAMEGWLIVLAATAGVSFGWLILGIVCAAKNSCAYSNKASELPCPELRTTVSWSFVLFAGWAVALGLMADVFAHRTSIDTPGQQASFITKMWVVELVCAVNILDWLRYVCRWMLDYILICCKSSCFDL